MVEDQRLQEMLTDMVRECGCEACLVPDQAARVAHMIDSYAAAGLAVDEAADDAAQADFEEWVRGIEYRESQDEWAGVSREDKAATLAARVDTVLAECNPSLPVYNAR